MAKRQVTTPKAISYALGLWATLTQYVDDTVVEIDNNAAKRALPTVSPNRKAFLHFGSDSGGGGGESGRWPDGRSHTAERSAC